MSKHKKIVILTGVFLMALSIAVCGQVKEGATANIDEPVTNQQESNVNPPFNLGMKCLILYNIFL